MAKVTVTDHPLVQHKVSMIRDKETSTKDFRALLREISLLMAYEVTRDFPLKQVEIETPMCKTKTNVVAGNRITLVPVLRAGLGMVDGMLELLPTAKVGHIGMYRDHDTLKPVEYYCKLPVDIAESDVIIIDPMLATAGSAVGAVKLLREKGVKNIKFVCVIASKFGVEKLSKECPDVDIFIASLDEKLNDDAYIIPGLGDAGDRIFGTK